MPQIRWTKSQVRELYRDVRAFNAARTKAIKRNPESANYLPEKLNVNDLKASIESRQELKMLTQDVNQALKYRFEIVPIKNGFVTKKEFVEAQGIVEIANQVKRRVAKERGVKIVPPRKSFKLGSEQEADLALFRTDLENIDMRDWPKFVQVVEDRISIDYYNWEDQQYKENYIEAIWKNLGASEDVLEIVEMVEKLSPRTLLQAARKDVRATFGYVYPNDQDQISEIIEGLRSVWSQYV